MPRVDTAAPWTELTLEERRERRRLRREKQREDNVKRPAKMHIARIKIDAKTAAAPPKLKQSVHVGCPGWRYWKWRDSFYAEVPQPGWFEHYMERFDTVEINASFYSWPTVAGVQGWRRQPWKKRFVYTVKVCELITHVKRFKGTKTLIRDFGMIANILATAWDVFCFSSRRATAKPGPGSKTLSASSTLPRRNIVEFRHVSWWNEEVYTAFRKAGMIYCSCSGPHLPDEIIRTADAV